MDLKDYFSFTAIALTFIGFAPYIRGIHRGTVHAHVFSWVIWGITTIIVFFAQLDADGGRGAWPIGVSGTITLYIALLAYQRRGDTKITRSDWLFFCAALSSLPIWYISADPVFAVIVLTTVDLLGFAPTLRKAYHQPYAESLTFFGLFALRNGLVVLALASYSLTTLLFPVAVGIACLFLIILVVFRRRFLRLNAAPSNDLPN
ncbi:hypothetical protein [Zhongshania aliphaticivorans]|jgi:hypothetical protein|uniref:hypothetical protein n=1 Tax=Zhongshania aliphaticivorans TaxID=1470434 RepID=UPI0039C987D7|tara:strand:+ start:227 stop:838 length:612 start_codon:yes stop_codon:yes gene_type:complete